MIKDKTPYIYSKHAKDEWIRDELGIIKHYPRTFFSAGCKKCIKDKDETYKVTYRYDDRTDLVLVVNDKGFVITNYRVINLNNKNNYKGTFYVDVKPKKKLRGKILSKF